MELYQIDPQKELNTDAISNIAQGVIYYVTTGRNAWHSTWVSRYKKDCMHTTIESAKSYAENNRSSGTVFYIKKLPCLVFRAKNRTLLVTEINNKNPLSGYSSDATSNMPNAKTNKIKGALDNYIKIGAPLVGAGLSFLHNSRFWRVKPNPKDAVMLLSNPKPNFSVEQDQDNDLSAYSSYSNGSNYYLGWKQIKTETSSSAITNIIKEASGENSISDDINIDMHSKQPADASKTTAQVYPLSGSEKAGPRDAMVKLRKISIIRNAPGSAASRESTITKFLEELSEILTYRAINRLDDNYLWYSYSRWTEAVTGGSDMEERIEWMIRCIHLLPYNFNHGA